MSLVTHPAEALPRPGPAQTPARPRSRTRRLVPVGEATLPVLAQRVAVPAYDRSRVRTGIVHLGVGAFFRAHQAVYLDDLMNRGQAWDWGITGVGVRPHSGRTSRVIAAQDGLYTVLVKRPDGTVAPRVVGSLLEHLHAPAVPDAVLGRMTDPATRVVSLTITPAGWRGEEDADRRHDAALPPGSLVPPRSALGFVVEALARRRSAGLDPFTVLSCDNLAGNGAVARRAVVGLAASRDPGLAAWIGSEVSFPESMVDRITPRTCWADRAWLAAHRGVADAWPVATEPASRWVLADEFPTGRPPLEDVGVRLDLAGDVPAAAQRAKLGLVNAGHQVLAHLGLLAGHRFVHEAAGDPLLHRFLADHLAHDVTPTLDAVPGLDLAGYRRQVLARFENPTLRDPLSRVAERPQERVARQVLPVVRARLAAGGDVTRGALVVAAAVQWSERCGAPRSVAVDEALLADPRFAVPFRCALASLRERGVAATLRGWVAV